MIAAFGAVVVVLAMAALLFRSGRVDAPFTDVIETWSIAVAARESPVQPMADWPRPSLGGSDTGLDDLNGVADPFLVSAQGSEFLFLEVIVRADGYPNGEHGRIGVARREDGEWIYEGIVLEEDFHLSYPHVFAIDGTYYMVPESSQDERVILYRADTFPGGWTEVATLLEGTFTDPTVFRTGASWWMFATTSTEDDDDTLRLYGADDIEGPWTEHPASPLVMGDTSRARQAGAVITVDGMLVRYAQDNTDGYGRAVRAFSILELTASTYAEEEISTIPVVEASGTGWNADGMHHISAIDMGGTWLVATDGYRYDRVFGWDR